MTILRAAIGGIVGLLVGYFAAAVLSSIVLGLFGASDFEGGRGMAAVFGFGPLGGLLGLVGGIWLGLRRGGAQPIGKTLARAGIALLAIVALAAGGLALYYFAIPHRLEYDQAGASLEFELRAPMGFALPDDPYKIEVTLDTDLNQQPAIWLDPALQQDGDWQARSSSITGPPGGCWCSGCRMAGIASSASPSPPSPIPRTAGAIGAPSISLACPASRRR